MPTDIVLVKLNPSLFHKKYCLYIAGQVHLLKRVTLKEKSHFEVFKYHFENLYILFRVKFMS